MDDETAAEPTLALKVEQHGRAATVSMTGELDALTAPELDEICLSIYERGARDLVIDLTATEFLDSSGLRALIGARQLFGTAGASMRLAHPSEPVMRLLDITGLAEYFSIDGSSSI